MVEGSDKLKQMEEEMDRFEAEIAHQSSGPPPNIPISGGFTFPPVTSFMPPQLRVHQNHTNVVQPVYSVLPLPPGVSMFVPLSQSHVSCYHMNVAQTHLPPPNSIFIPSKASNMSVPTSKTEVVPATSVHKDTSNDINSNQKVITAPPQMAGPNELAERAKQAAAAVAAAKSRAEDEDDDVTRALLAAAAGVTYTRVQGPDGKEKVLASITKPPLTPVVTQPSKKLKSADLITDTEVNKVTQSIIMPPVPPSIHRSASTNTSDQVYKKKKYIRTAAGATWEDPTLVEWDPTSYDSVEK
ncbi:RNA-binding protein 42 [Schistosoma japonicum]|nr:RNA-binding protein 42 [Schistosoma japonicum]